MPKKRGRKRKTYVPRRRAKSASKARSGRRRPAKRSTRSKKRSKRMQQPLSQISLPQIRPGDILRKKKEQGEGAAEAPTSKILGTVREPAVAKEDLLPPTRNQPIRAAKPVLPKAKAPFPDKPPRRMPLYNKEGKGEMTIWKRILGDEFLAVSAIIIFGSFLKLGYGALGAAITLGVIATFSFICGVSLKGYVKNQL